MRVARLKLRATQAKATLPATAPPTKAPASCRKPADITEFAETHEYDVVVVGAGESGLSAIHTALEAGATVGVLQSLSIVQTAGNMAAAVDLTKTDEAGVKACVSFVNYKSDWRSNAAQVEAWARNSQEALAWWEEAALAGGIESKPYDYSVSYNGHEFFLHANTYFHEEGHQKSALLIGEDLAAAGAEFYFETPCVQLYKEGERVAGAIGQNADGGYVLLKAAKGVILATGDYVGDTEMLEYYTPDAKGLHQAVDFRNGSGLKAGMWAGAQMCPASHTKMVHGESAAVRFEMPYLFLDRHGNRFMDEGCCRMGYLNEFTKKYLKEVDFADSTAAKFFSIVPMNWEEHYEQWKDFSDISIHNAYRNVDPEQWIKADTLEDLAEAMIAYADEQKWAHRAGRRRHRGIHQPLQRASGEGFRRRLRQAQRVPGAHRGPLLCRAARREQHRLPGRRPRRGRQLPVPRRGHEPHRRAVRRRQRVGPVLRRRQLSHGHRGSVGGSRHHHRLCDRPLRGRPLGLPNSSPRAAAALRRCALPLPGKAGPMRGPAFVAFRRSLRTSFGLL